MTAELEAACDATVDHEALSELGDMFAAHPVAWYTAADVANATPAERRALGLCGQRGCEEMSGDVDMCALHRSALAEWPEVAMMLPASSAGRDMPRSVSG